MQLPYDENHFLALSHRLFGNICIFSSSASDLQITSILFYHLYFVYIVSTETLLFLSSNWFAPWCLEITYLDDHFIPSISVSKQIPLYPSQLNQIIQKIVPRRLARQHHQCSFHLLLLKSHILLSHTEIEQLS